MRKVCSSVGLVMSTPKISTTHPRMHTHTHARRYTRMHNVTCYEAVPYLEMENECPHESEGQFGVTVHQRLVLYVHQLDLENQNMQLSGLPTNPLVQKPSDQSCSQSFVTVQLLTLCKHGDGRSGRSCHMLGDAM